MDGLGEFADGPDSSAPGRRKSSVVSQGSVQSAQSLMQNVQSMGGAMKLKEELKAELSEVRKKQKKRFAGSIFIYDDEDAFWSLREMGLLVVGSPIFDACVGIIILANSVVIGIEIQAKRDEDKAVEGICRSMEMYFLMTYIVELLLRFFAYRSRCFSDPWVLFDMVLVISGLLMSFVLEPMSLNHQLDQLPQMQVLRMGRLFRLVRAVRLLQQFQDLWLLVRGLLSSVRTMVFTYILLGLMVYIFACLGVEILFSTISHESKEVQADCESRWNSGVDIAATDPDCFYSMTIRENFGTLPLSMLTLVKFICLDDISSLYWPLMIYQNNPTVVFYFLMLIMVIGIVAMNLVTAVIVNGALEQAKMDVEVKEVQHKARKTVLLREIAKLFATLDQDGGGTLTIDELMQMDEDVNRKLLEILEGDISPSDLFLILDKSGEGEISFDEFFDGLYALAISETPIYIYHLQVEIEKNRKAFPLLVARLEDEITKSRAVFSETVHHLRQALCEDHAQQLKSAFTSQRQSASSAASTSRFGSIRGMPDFSDLSSKNLVRFSDPEAPEEKLGSVPSAPAAPAWPHAPELTMLEARAAQVEAKKVEDPVATVLVHIEGLLKSLGQLSSYSQSETLLPLLPRSPLLPRQRVRSPVQELEARHHDGALDKPRLVALRQLQGMESAKEGPATQGDQAQVDEGDAVLDAEAV